MIEIYRSVLDVPIKLRGGTKVEKLKIFLESTYGRVLFTSHDPVFEFDGPGIIEIEGIEVVGL